MLRGSYIKEKSTVHLTIHELRLPQEYTDMFQVEWIRGESNGLTQQCLPDDNNTVTFEKTYKCPVTMYISKRDGSFRGKNIRFKINRYISGTTRKTFGEVDVDISDFFGKTPKPESYPVKSPHSKESILVLSFTVISNQETRTGNMTGTENDLTSASEAMPSYDIRATEWDVSDAQEPESQEKLKQWCEEQMALKSSTPSLSGFHRIPSRRRIPQATEQQSPEDTVKDLFNTDLSHSSSRIPLNRQRSSEALMGFLSSSRSSTNMLSRKKKLAPIGSGLFSISEEPSLPAVSEETKVEKKDPQVEAKNLIISVLAKKWCNSPINLESISPSTSALYAALIYSKVMTEDINEDIFEEIKTKIIAGIKENQLIEHGTSIDLLYFALQLISLLSNGEDETENRRKKLTSELKKYVTETIESVVQPRQSDLSNIVNEVVTCLLDMDSLVKSLNFAIKSAVERTITEGPLQAFFRKLIIQLTDRMLVNGLVTSPFNCSFGNSVQWNTLITIVANDDINLELFREAVSVFMMGMGIVADPPCSDSICPHLPKPTVLRLLSNQQPDDFMPMPNDVMPFMHAYSIDSNVSAELPTAFDGEISELLALVSPDWKQAKFSPETLRAFPYLSTYFS